MEYEDFDLLIEQTGKSYRARVLNSPCGQAYAKFTIPFSDLELENFLLRFNQPQRGVRRVESRQMDAAKKFGGQLFDCVFKGQLQSALLGSIDKSKAKGVGLRIRLRLNDVPKLASIPWEYLYQSQLNRFFSLSDQTPVVRYLEMPDQIPALPVKPPLRILAMIASPSDYQPLDVTNEIKKLRAALSELERRQLVVLDQLETPTLANLRRRLDQSEYNIFHFIGHGGFDEQTQDGVLLMETERGQGHPVGAQTLSFLIHDHESLRLAVLNACEGAHGSVNDPFSGTAQNLVQQGVPAVIAMQFSITDDAAITFSQEFYTAIAAGRPVDTALAKSRLAIFTEGHGVEWGTPVLYLRSADGRIFDVDMKEVDLAPIITALPFNQRMTKPVGALRPDSPYYVERQSDKIGLREIVGEEGSTITILGARQIGKTSLLYRLIDAGTKVNKRFVSLNFQGLDSDDLTDSDNFFRRFCKLISRELDLEDRTADYWDESVGIIQRCSDYIGDYILKELGGRLILAMDEVEVLFRTSFRSEFFRMLRVWHNNRALFFSDPVWRNLDIVIATSTEPYYFIDDLSQSPFNVATEVRLRDFTPDQVTDLNERYRSPLKTQDIVELLALVGGHPFLVHQGIYLVASGTIATSDLFISSLTDNSPFYDYLQHLMLRLQKNPEMTACLREVIDHNKCAEARSFFRLESAGLVRREGQKVMMRCKLYDEFFKEYLHA